LFDSEQVDFGHAFAVDGKYGPEETHLAITSWYQLVRLLRDVRGLDHIDRRMMAETAIYEDGGCAAHIFCIFARKPTVKTSCSSLGTRAHFSPASEMTKVAIASIPMIIHFGMDA